MNLITTKQIMGACKKQDTFYRGEEKYYQGDVEKLVLEKASLSEMEVCGTVEGSSGNRYATTATILFQDEKYKTAGIKSYACECRAFSAYSGLCKHLVATLLEFNECCETRDIRTFMGKSDRGEQIIWSGFAFDEDDYDEDDYDDPAYDEDDYDDTAYDADIYEEDYDGEPEESYLWDDPVAFLKRMLQGEDPFASEKKQYHMADKVMPVSSVVSSTGLLAAMSEVSQNERRTLCREMAVGEVELEPTLHFLADEERVDFKIGTKQLYVLKNIQDFLRNVDGQQFVRYGKNLEFLHSESAFTPGALRLMEAMRLEEFQPQNVGRYGYYYSGSVDKRYLYLNAPKCDVFFSALEGQSLHVEDFTGERKGVYTVQVVRRDPKLPVLIRAEEGERAATIGGPTFFCLEGVRRLYVIYGNLCYICSEEYSAHMRSVARVLMRNLTKERQREAYTAYIAVREKAEPQCLSERDYPEFVASLLPILQKYTDLTIEGVDFEQYRMEEGRYEVYLDVDKEQNILCDARAVYGEQIHDLLQVGEITENYRDIRTEYELRKLIFQYFDQQNPMLRPTNNPFFANRPVTAGTLKQLSYVLPGDDLEKLASFVEIGVSQLQNLAEVYASEAFKRIQINHVARISAGLSLKGNLLQISWDLENMSENELYDILSAYRRKKKYYRLQNGEILNLENSGLGVMAELQDNLHLSKAELQAGMAEIPAYRAMYLDCLLDENRGRIEVSRDDMFREFVDNFDKVKHKVYEVPDLVKAELRGYQLEGYRWACALEELGFGGILADDMGLGKTLQMIAYMCAHREGTHLVVCPASLVYNWEAEILRFAPELSVCAVAGPAAERKAQLERYRDYDVLLTSYDLLRRDITNYEGKSFATEIIDEAQYIKNANTLAAKAVRSIESRTRFALTGTPIENRLSELWSIFEYLLPGYLFSQKYFKELFEEKIMIASEQEESALDRLHRMVSPFILRRLKKDVLHELPDKLEEVVYSRFGTEQQKLYQATEKKIVMTLNAQSGQEVQENKLLVLAELTKLRQICCDPTLLYQNYKGESAKLDTCLELVANALAGGHRILLFSQFTTMLDILAERLKEQRVKYFMLTGSTGKVKRRDLVERFQNGEADVFLISLKAGGTGLNLTAADVVIHYDPWWNVAAQNQATDRTHRIGQENEVTVFKLIAKDTIEERILKLQERKKDLADRIISVEGTSVAGMTREDILELFA